MDSKQRGWGGQRQGAGRKPSANVRVSLSIPREAWDEIAALAQQQNILPEQLSVAWLLERVVQVGATEK